MSAGVQTQNSLRRLADSSPGARGTGCRITSTVTCPLPGYVCSTARLRERQLLWIGQFSPHPHLTLERDQLHGKPGTDRRLGQLGQAQRYFKDHLRRA